MRSTAPVAESAAALHHNRWPTAQRIGSAVRNGRPSGARRTDKPDQHSPPARRAATPPRASTNVVYSRQNIVAGGNGQLSRMIESGSFGVFPCRRRPRGGSLRRQDRWPGEKAAITILTAACGHRKRRRPYRKVVAVPRASYRKPHGSGCGAEHPAGPDASVVASGLIARAMAVQQLFPVRTAVRYRRQRAPGLALVAGPSQLRTIPVLHLVCEFRGSSEKQTKL